MLCWKWSSSNLCQSKIQSKSQSLVPSPGLSLSSSSGWGKRTGAARANMHAVNTCIARAFRFIGSKVVVSGHPPNVNSPFFQFGVPIEGWITRAMLSGRRTRFQRLTSNLIHMFRETKALHLSWYINWYRFLVRAFAESVWRRIDPKGGLVKNKLSATTSTGVELR